MRAKSIGEIREHLVKGGWVQRTTSDTESVYAIDNEHAIIRISNHSLYIRSYYEIPLHALKPEDWNLVCTFCNGSKVLYNEFEPYNCPECSIEENGREIKKLDDEFTQVLIDTNKALEDHVQKLEAVLSNIAVMVGAEPSKDPFECEQRILEKLDKTLPLDIKLDHLRECILDGSEEDALGHLFDLISGLRCKYIEDKHLTRIGIEKKAWWNEQ